MAAREHMKKTLATLALGTLLLTGCASGNQDANTGEKTYLYEANITLRDGRTVTCVELLAGYAGGVSCDWDGAK